MSKRDSQTTAESTLIDKMRSLADHGHSRADELRQHAAALDKAMENFEAKALLGAWSRARRLWCDCTGEPLI